MIEINTKFILINNIPNSILNKLGVLYVSTHNYEHKDIFVTFNYFKNINKKFIMLFADKAWNYMLEPLRPNNIEFMYVTNNTVEKISNKLLLGQDIIMFLYKESNSSGPYYILKNTKSPLVFIKIKNKDNPKLTLTHYNNNAKDIYIKNFLCTYLLEFKKINYKLSKYTNINMFLKQFKKSLYS
tara:strand:- start:28 stop:579 length:552 start_codon:yes stop_codon:yes gene_type:complete